MSTSKDAQHDQSSMKWKSKQERDTASRPIMATIKKTDNNKRYKWYGEIGTLIHRWVKINEDAAVLKITGQFLKSYKEVSYNSAIPIRYIPKKWKLCLHKNLYTISNQHNLWQPKDGKKTADEWMSQNVVYLYNEYY